MGAGGAACEIGSKITFVLVSITVGYGEMHQDRGMIRIRHAHGEVVAGKIHRVELSWLAQGILCPRHPVKRMSAIVGAYDCVGKTVADDRIRIYIIVVDRTMYTQEGGLYYLYPCSAFGPPAARFAYHLPILRRHIKAGGNLQRPTLRSARN